MQGGLQKSTGGPAAAPQRGGGSAGSTGSGFFRTLSQHYGKEQCFQLRKPQTASHQRLSQGGAEATETDVPILLAAQNGSLPGSPASTTKPATEGTSGPPPTRFLDRLSLDFLAQLWSAIKQNSMMSNAARGGNPASHEVIDLQDFKRLWHQHWDSPDMTCDPEPYLEAIFASIDRRKRGAVQTTDIATAFVLICSEDRLPKLKSLFRIFDADDDSCLTHDEIFDMYLSIKVNDTTRNRQDMAADIAFDEELSLQEAKRLYELTVEHLSGESDFVIFEEFARVFDRRPHLLENLLPGSFSLEWILTAYKVPSMEGHAFGLDVRKGLVSALRRGEEHLNLSKRRGRGHRVMQHCLQSRQPHRPALVNSEPVAPPTPPNGTGFSGGNSGRRLSRGAPATASATAATTKSPQRTIAAGSGSPKLSTSQRSRTDGHLNSPRGKTQRDAGASGTGMSSSATAGFVPSATLTHYQLDAVEDESDSDDGYAAYFKVAPDAYRSGGAGGQSSSMPRSMPLAAAAAAALGKLDGNGAGRVSYSIQEALDVPTLPVLTLNHKNSKRFREIVLNEQTQQAYLRDKNADVNRTTKFQCLVCAVTHEFALGKPVASTSSAEHQH